MSIADIGRLIKDGDIKNVVVMVHTNALLVK